MGVCAYAPIATALGTGEGVAKDRSVQACKHDHGSYKTSVPITVSAATGCVTTCIALVDSGNTWTNCISLELLNKLGYDVDELESVTGGRCKTAKKGAEMRVLGRVKKPIRIQLGDMKTKFKDRPMVLEGLSMNYNISGNFLKFHQIDQLHSKGVLRVQGQEIPLISSITENALQECINPNLRVYTTENVKVPPKTQKLIPVTVGAPLSKEDHKEHSVMISGSAAFMRKTDLHPWCNVVTRADNDGNMGVGVMNTTDYTIDIPAYTYYGIATLTTTEEKEKQEPGRICLIEPQAYAATVSSPPASATTTKGKEPVMTPLNLRDPSASKEELPAWMQGATTDKNREKRLQHLIRYFKLDQTPCLPDTKDVHTAALLLLRYWDVFSFDGSFGTTTLVKHEIKLKPGHEKPINTGFRPINPSLEPDLRRQLDKWLAHNIIERSKSPWAFSLVAAPKKDDKGGRSNVRWCVDYRELNKATIGDSCPIGHIEDNLSKLARSTIFSGIDGAGAFHVIPLAEEDKEKTTFNTPWGSFRFICMPFGLSNGPATYARLVNMVLEGIPYDVALPYLDDTVVHSATLPQHYANLDRVLSAMKKAGLRLQPSKCQLFKDRIQYLGHEVSKDGIRPVPEYVEVVKTWPIPRTRTAVRGFLGKVGYYRRFIRNFAAIASPLYEKLKYPDDSDQMSKRKLDKEEFDITEPFRRSFETLKAKLITAPILAYPDFKSKEPFIVDTDWSADANACGAVLSQVQEGQERVIAYAAKKLSPAQASYSSTKGELAAIIIFLNKWSYYLRHRPFILRTDNQALKWIHSMAAPKGMIARWLDILSNHEFTVEHRAGLKHGNADALSRAPHLEYQGDTDVSEGECSSISALWEATLGAIDDDNAPENQEHWSPAFLAEQQQMDEELRCISEHVRNRTELTHEENSALSRTGRIWLGLKEDLRHDKHGILRHCYFDPQYGEQKLILLPPNLWNEAARRAHEEIAHMGVSATVERLRKHFFFPGMFRVVTEVNKSCLVCQRRENKPADQRHTLFSHMDGYPFRKLSVDFVGPLPRSRRGNEYLFTVRDVFTRWLEAFPVKRATAEVAVNLLIKEIFSRFGLCESIHSDRGSQFTSGLFQEVAKELGVELTVTPAYNPKSNPVERAHRDLGRALKALVGDKPHAWEEYLPQVLFVMRTATCRSTGFAPYRLMFGRDATTPLDLIFGSPPASDRRTAYEYVEALTNRIESAHAWARRNMGLTVARQRKAYYQQKPDPFLPGDKVWLFTPTNKPGQRRKFNLYWTGPWTVKRRRNELCYELFPNPTWMYFDRPVVVSIDRLKPYFEAEGVEQPPGPDDNVQMPGDEFAEAIPNQELDDEEEEIATGPRQPPIRPPQNEGANAGGQPPEAEGGADDDDLGFGPLFDDEVQEDEEEEDEEEVFYVPPAPLPHGPRLDAERERLRQEEEDRARRRAEENAGRNERQRQREERMRQLQEDVRQLMGDVTLEGLVAEHGQRRGRELYDQYLLQQRRQ